MYSDRVIGRRRRSLLSVVVVVGVAEQKIKKVIGVGAVVVGTRRHRRVVITESSVTRRHRRVAVVVGTYLRRNASFVVVVASGFYDSRHCLWNRHRRRHRHRRRRHRHRRHRHRHRRRHHHRHRCRCRPSLPLSRGCTPPRACPVTCRDTTRQVAATRGGEEEPLAY